MTFKQGPGDTLIAQCDGMNGRDDCTAQLGPFELQRGPAEPDRPQGYLIRVLGEREDMASRGWSTQRRPQSEQARLYSGSDHFCPEHWRWHQDGDHVDARTAHEFLRDATGRTPAEEKTDG